MQSEFTTERLTLHSLTLNEQAFILALLNTPGWLKFIGDRKVRTLEDAANYINRINQNRTVKYWVVAIEKGQTPIGIITFIKRDYLTHHDIGFAFLPAFAKHGYAFEAASVIINYLSEEHLQDRLLATTLPGNMESIRLLIKLGFHLYSEIEVGKEKLLVYSLATV